MAERMNTARGQETNHGTNTNLKGNQGGTFQCVLKQGCLREIIMMFTKRYLNIKGRKLPVRASFDL